MKKLLVLLLPLSLAACSTGPYGYGNYGYGRYGSGYGYNPGYGNSNGDYNDDGNYYDQGYPNTYGNSGGAYGYSGGAYPYPYAYGRNYAPYGYGYNYPYYPYNRGRVRVPRQSSNMPGNPPPREPIQVTPAPPVFGDNTGSANPPPPRGFRWGPGNRINPGSAAAPSARWPFGRSASGVPPVAAANPSVAAPQPPLADFNRQPAQRSWPSALTPGGGGSMAPRSAPAGSGLTTGQALSKAWRRK